MTGLPGDCAATDMIARYLAASRTAKYRRLAGLIAISVVLVAVLILIYSMGWTNFDTAHTGNDAGAGWVVVGLGVGILAIAGVITDIIYRRKV